MSFTENKKTGQAYRVCIDQDPFTLENTYDRLSFWTAASDVEFTNGSNLEQVSGAFFYYEGTLLAQQTTVTISGDYISTTGLLDVYVPDEFCKVTPSKIEREGHTVTLTFPKQETNMGVRVVCKELTNGNPDSAVSGGSTEPSSGEGEGEGGEGSGEGEGGEG